MSAVDSEDGFDWLAVTSGEVVSNFGVAFTANKTLLWRLAHFAISRAISLADFRGCNMWQDLGGKKNTNKHVIKGLSETVSLPKTNNIGIPWTWHPLLPSFQFLQL